ncbi:MAG: lasso peptide biosynthesis B2 protein [Sphingopyxis sp.]|uniref:lasso peptide biosynthesis B2 protein n=1 Tax=Sphingopyxis sp. TaxID=1908224 RepID=UPI003D80E6D6
MGWQLTPGIGYCEAGGELVFLDLTRDKYFALRGLDRGAFERLRAGEPNDSDAMSRLVATGLLARAEGASRLDPARAAVPFDDLASHEDGAFSLPMSLRAASALHWARRAMRPTAIGTTIGKFAEAKRRLGVVGDEGAIVDIAKRYAACRWLVPVPTRCLIDALALDRILLSRQLVATLVFGVRRDPFAAHCWLQTPETVLTGTSAEARNYTPILVIG